MSQIHLDNHINVQGMLPAWVSHYRKSFTASKGFIHEGHKNACIVCAEWSQLLWLEIRRDLKVSSTKIKIAINLFAIGFACRRDMGHVCPWPMMSSGSRLGLTDACHTQLIIWRVSHSNYLAWLKSSAGIACIPNIDGGPV